VRSRTKSYARKSGKAKTRRAARAPSVSTSERSARSSLGELQRLAGNSAVTALVARQPATAEVDTQTHSTLREGKKGVEVRELQLLLDQNAGVKLPLDGDGIFGPLTARAARQFQSAHPPLEVDGIVGPKTWEALDGAKDEPQDEVAVARKIFQRGTEAFGRGDFAHAYDFYTRANEVAPRPQLQFDRAQCLRLLGGRREEAIALYEEYIASGGARAAEAQANVDQLKGPGQSGDPEVDKDNARAVFMKGNELFKQGKYALAYDEFTKADETFHKPGIVFDRAQCLRLLGAHREHAIALYEQYIAEGSEHLEEAKGYVAELKGPDKTGDEAADTAEARKLFMKANAFFEAGDYAHAYDEFTKADELAHRPALDFDRAQALRKLGGRNAEAVALYQQYLDESADGPSVREAAFFRDALSEQGAEAK
jgi:peptidoglycan hydrolase-like protein with peptidoglycan-binding domain